MIKSMAALVVVAVGMACVAQAGTAPTAQQEKMKSCNADATSKGLKGDDRKAFMKGCLSSAAAAPAARSLTPQQQKMGACSKDAKSKGLKGDARKQFMKDCLKG